MSTLTKEALVSMFSDKLGMPLKDSKNLLELMLEELKSKLENGDEVKISNFGKWMVKNKRSRLGRNPNTGDAMEIAARKVVTFHPSEKLRKQMNVTWEAFDSDHAM